MSNQFNGFMDIPSEFDIDPKHNLVNVTIEHFATLKEIYGYIYYPTQISKLTEYAGRMCYNSHDKINETSDIGFNRRTMKSVHLSVEAHGFIGLVIHPFGTNKKAYYEELKSHLFEYSKLMNVYAGEGYNTIEIHFNIRSLIDYIINIWKKKPKLNGYETTFFTLFATICMRLPVLEPLLSFISEYVEKEKYMEQEIESVIWYSDITVISYNEKGDTQVNHYVGKEAIPVPEVKPYELYTGLQGIDISILNVTMNPHYIPGYHMYEDASVLPSPNDPVMGSVTFKVTIPRIVSQQEVRHWESIFTDEMVLELGAISQKSQRYVNEGNMECYFRPSTDTKKKYQVEVDGYLVQLSIEDFIELDKVMYRNMVEDGYPKEEARNLLLNGVYSDIIITKEFKALPHYFAERTARGAQAEIRAYATALMEFMENLNIKEGLFTPSKYNAELSGIK